MVLDWSLTTSFPRIVHVHQLQSTSLCEILQKAFFIYLFNILSLLYLEHPGQFPQQWVHVDFNGFVSCMLLELRGKKTNSTIVQIKRAVFWGASGLPAGCFTLSQDFRKGLFFFYRRDKVFTGARELAVTHCQRNTMKGRNGKNIHLVSGVTHLAWFEKTCFSLPV